MISSRQFLAQEDQQPSGPSSTMGLFPGDIAVCGLLRICVTQSVTLHSKADIRGYGLNVRFVPIAGVCLFDHLVGARRNRLRHLDAERLRAGCGWIVCFVPVADSVGFEVGTPGARPVSGPGAKAPLSRSPAALIRLKD